MCYLAGRWSTRRPEKVASNKNTVLLDLIFNVILKIFCVATYLCLLKFFDFNLRYSVQKGVCLRREL